MFTQDVVNLWVLTKLIIKDMGREITEEDIREFVESLWKRDSLRKAFVKEYGIEEKDERKIEALFKKTVVNILKKYEEEASEVGF